MGKLLSWLSERRAFPSLIAWLRKDVLFRHYDWVGESWDSGNLHKREWDFFVVSF